MTPQEFLDGLASGVWVEWLEQWWRDNAFVIDLVLSRWSLIQLAVMLVAFALAHRFDAILEPRLENWLRGQRQHPRLLRLLLLIVRRLEWILFSALVWTAYLIMAAATWPSRSYLLGIASSLTVAWLIISISSRVIANRLLAKTVALFVFVVTALDLLKLLAPAQRLLDSVGMEVGQVRISPLLIVQGLVAGFVLISLAATISRLIESRIRSSSELAPATRELLVKLLRPLLLLIAFVTALNWVGIDLSAFALFSGALGIGIGFGLQKAVSNLISGVILLMDKSIKPGDVISLGNTFGWITELSARYVAVRTREGHTHLIPNEDLITQQVVNWTHSSTITRLELTFKVAYDSDPHQVRHLAAEAVSRPKRVIPDPAPVCHLFEFADSSLDFVVRFWIADPSNGVVNIKGEVLLAIWDALKVAGIRVPLPHRQLVVERPLPIDLGGAAQPFRSES